MDARNKEILFEIVANAVAEVGAGEVANAIDNANRGRPDGYIVKNSNQHLFRQYRNTVSPNAVQLLRDARAWADSPQTNLASLEEIEQTVGQLRTLALGGGANGRAFEKYRDSYLLGEAIDALHRLRDEIVATASEEKP